MVTATRIVIGSSLYPIAYSHHKLGQEQKECLQQWGIRAPISSRGEGWQGQQAHYIVGSRGAAVGQSQQVAWCGWWGNASRWHVVGGAIVVEAGGIGAVAGAEATG